MPRSDCTIAPRRCRYQPSSNIKRLLGLLESAHPLVDRCRRGCAPQGLSAPGRGCSSLAAVSEGREGQDPPGASKRSPDFSGHRSSEETINESERTIPLPSSVESQTASGQHRPWASQRRSRGGDCARIFGSTISGTPSTSVRLWRASILPPSRNSWDIPPSPQHCATCTPRQSTKESNGDAGKLQSQPAFSKARKFRVPIKVPTVTFFPIFQSC